jgi:hypothetical protein
VDGVLTNCTVLINGTDYHLIIHVKDSYAIQYASKLGYKILIGRLLSFCLNACVLFSLTQPQRQNHQGKAITLTTSLGGYLHPHPRKQFGFLWRVAKPHG